MNFLIVVSNPDIRASLADSVRNRGDMFTEFNTVEDALDALKATDKEELKFDRIISDELTYGGHREWWIVPAALSAGLGIPMTLVTSDTKMRENAAAFGITSFIDISEDVGISMRREFSVPGIFQEAER